MNKFDPTSHNITDEQRARLKESFPEAFTEQGLDFDRLRTLLGEVIETGPERYSFTWPGKTEAIRAAQASSMGTLAPDKASSVDWETTENLYLEGDNMEILKLLQKSYTGKVKMIYIDPPYNTGQDFVYPDNYGEGLKTYLEYTGQIDGEGKKLTTNTETDGRYHSKWLNMMYPRLMLARNLLRDDGVIFVSIDDHEVVNLSKICNEIFGEENFIAKLIWKSRQIVDSRTQTGVSTDHEYILIYRKSESGKLRGKKSDITKYTNPDNDPRGVWMSNTILGLATADQRPNLHYDLIDPATDRKFPPPPGTGWRYSRATMEEKIKDNRIIFPKKDDGRPRERKFLAELANEFTGFSTILPLEVGYTLNGTREVRDLLEGSYFPFPKPASLIQFLIEQVSQPDDLILDFFSGSATTAHAAMFLNANDGGNRKYILSQLQEPTDMNGEERKAGYKNICEIGKERIRRAAIKIREDNADEIKQRSNALDTGFKVYELTRSTFNVWDVTNEDDLQQKLVEATSLIKGDAREEDVLTELILKSGYGLTEKVEQITIGNKKLFSIAGGQLIVSLESGLTLDHVRQIAERKPTQFVAREHGFAGDDVLTNTAQIMKDKGIDFRVL